MKRTDSHHSRKNGIKLFERLSEYIDQELDTSTCKKIEMHINACRPYQVYLGTLKKTVDLSINHSFPTHEKF